LEADIDLDLRRGRCDEYPRVVAQEEGAVFVLAVRMALSKTLAIDDDVCDIFITIPQVVPQNLEGDAVYHAPLNSDGAVIAGGTILVTTLLGVISGAFVVDDLNHRSHRSAGTAIEVPVARVLRRAIVRVALASLWVQYVALRV
jgi:hypothetical protein